MQDRQQLHNFYKAVENIFDFLKSGQLQSSRVKHGQDSGEVRRGWESSTEVLIGFVQLGEDS